MKKILAAVSLLAAAGTFAAADSPAFKQDYQVELDAASRSETESLAAAYKAPLRRAEYLGRGVSAVPSADGVLVSWRFLGTDSADIRFNVYKGKKKLNAEPLFATNFFDEGKVKKATYTVVPVLNGVENTKEAATASVGKKTNDYLLSFPVKQYKGKDYTIYDASVGDLDGDGEYEIVVRRNPLDMEIPTRTCYPLIEAYRMDGTHLWTVDVGPNEICDIDINFLVYDFDGDGKSEMVMRSFEGTVDGTGAVIGDVDGDGITDYKDSLVKFKDRQYLSKGPEFLSVYDGMTGKEVARTPMLPARDPLQPWGNFPEGDGRNVKRANHFLFAAAELGGKTPSIVMVRGCWNAVGAAAWDYDGKSLSVRWLRPIDPVETIDNLYNAGYHSLAVADVDFDGKDEILSGAMAIDDDGSIMYATSVNGVKLRHGDAFDVAVISKDFPGYLVWSCHENKNLPTNIELHDARTGQVLFGLTKPKDTGRSRSADIDPTHPGWEVWGSTATPLQTLKGEFIAGDPTTMSGKPAFNAPLPMNAKLYWTGDLLAELFDYTKDGHTPSIQKWNWEKKACETIWTADGCSTNNGTKGNACLIADLFGDWREEIITRTADDKEIRIYATAIPTKYRLPTLMHDKTYREAIAWQNNHYNQPANLSFYLGAEADSVPLPAVFTEHEGKTVVAPAYAASSEAGSAVKLVSVPLAAN
ncbi:MAG: hypothetical protein K6G80_02415 [Treponema sp.]|nr:hypothetical protein [Treponema sp.]